MFISLRITKRWMGRRCFMCLIHNRTYGDSVVQDWIFSIANALETLQSHTKLSMYPSDPLQLTHAELSYLAHGHTHARTPTNTFRYTIDKTQKWNTLEWTKEINISDHMWNVLKSWSKLLFVSALCLESTFLLIYTKDFYFRLSKAVANVRNISFYWRRPCCVIDRKYTLGLNSFKRRCLAGIGIPII